MFFLFFFDYHYHHRSTSTLPHHHPLLLHLTVEHHKKHTATKHRSPFILLYLSSEKYKPQHPSLSLPCIQQKKKQLPSLVDRKQKEKKPPWSSPITTFVVDQLPPPPAVFSGQHSHGQQPSSCCLPLLHLVPSSLISFLGLPALSSFTFSLNPNTHITHTCMLPRPPAPCFCCSPVDPRPPDATIFLVASSLSLLPCDPNTAIIISSVFIDRARSPHLRFPVYFLLRRATALITFAAAGRRLSFLVMNHRRRSMQPWLLVVFIWPEHHRSLLFTVFITAIAMAVH